MSFLATEQFIAAELSKRGISWHYDYSHKNIMVGCPFHKYEGIKEKLSIHVSGKVARCWVCHKTVTYNELADVLGLEKINWQKIPKPSAIGEAQYNLDELFNSNSPSKFIELLDHLDVWQRKWRGLSKEFLATVPSYEWADRNNKLRIVWPVRQFGKTPGVTSYLGLDKDLTTPGALKQWNSPGKWASKVLFPIDHSVIKDRIVLVEGQYDALRLLSYGIPAACIFGTGNWNVYKRSILFGKGIKRVILAFDGDEAGAQVTQQAYADLKSNFDTRIMLWPVPPDDAADELGRPIKNYDPGSCPVKLLNVIKMLMS